MSLAQSIVVGATLSGKVPWTAATDDDANVKSVDFYIDGTKKWTEGYAPWQFNGDPSGLLDTTTLPDGSHDLKVVATLKSGSTADSSSSVTVNNANPVPQPVPPMPTPPNPVPPASTGNPSGVAPTGVLPGWNQVFVDDFSGQNIPVGGVGDSGLPKWNMYPSLWHGTPAWAHYFPAKTVSINNSVLDIYMHQQVINNQTDHLIAAMVPKLFPGGADETNQLYGRYITRWKADFFKGYHASPLLWPKSNIWPRDGEIDFPEGDFDGHVASFIHWQGGTSGGSQSAYSTGVLMGGSGWHTSDLTWLPNRVTMLLDGVKIGELTTTSKIPNTPMHFVWQMNGSYGSAYPAGCGQGHMQMDWMVAYSAAGAT